MASPRGGNGFTGISVPSTDLATLDGVRLTPIAWSRNEALDWRYEDDPDGNGKQDTWGMGGAKGLTRMSYVYNPHGVTGFDEWWPLDGQIVPVAILPGIKDALAFLKRASDAGVIDPDLYVQSIGDYAGKVSAGAYDVIDFWSNGVINVFLPAMQQRGLPLPTPGSGPPARCWRCGRGPPSRAAPAARPTAAGRSRRRGGRPS